jgi:hypothetical protein
LEPSSFNDEMAASELPFFDSSCQSPPAYDFFPMVEIIDEAPEDDMVEKKSQGTVTTVRNIEFELTKYNQMLVAKGTLHIHVAEYILKPPSKTSTVEETPSIPASIPSPMELSSIARLHKLIMEYKVLTSHYFIYFLIRRAFCFCLQLTLLQ